MELAQNNSLTVSEVLDCATGQIVSARDVLTIPVDEAIQLRMQLAEIAKGHGAPRYECPSCGQLLVLHSDSRKSLHFSHMAYSEPCPIKSTNEFSTTERELIRYQSTKESDRHKFLKNQLADCLRLDPDVSHVQVERIARSAKEKANWRRPDITAHFKGHKIAFEIQLSVISIDLIVARKLFYAEQGIYLIWILERFGADYQNRLMMLNDLFYNNNLNAFIFNEACIEASVLSGKLQMECFYVSYENSEDQISNTAHNKVISLHDLTFNSEQNWVYYFDADNSRKEAELAAVPFIKKRKEKEARDADEWSTYSTSWGKSNSISPFDNHDIYLTNDKIKMLEYGYQNRRNEALKALSGNTSSWFYILFRSGKIQQLEAQNRSYQKSITSLTTERINLQRQLGIFKTFPSLEVNGKEYLILAPELVVNSPSLHSSMYVCQQADFGTLFSTPQLRKGTEDELYRAHLHVGRYKYLIAQDEWEPEIKRQLLQLDQEIENAKSSQEKLIDDLVYEIEQAYPTKHEQLSQLLKDLSS